MFFAFFTLDSGKGSPDSYRRSSRVRLGRERVYFAGGVIL